MWSNFRKFRNDEMWLHTLRREDHCCKAAKIDQPDGVCKSCNPPAIAKEKKAKIGADRDSEAAAPKMSTISTKATKRMVSAIALATLLEESEAQDNPAVWTEQGE